MSNTASRELSAVSLDEHGILRRDNQWIALANFERKVLALLLMNFEHVVTHDQFCAELWPGRDTQSVSRPLRVHVCRLRKKIACLGLTITTIRNEGLLLHDRH